MTTAKTRTIVMIDCKFQSSRRAYLIESKHSGVLVMTTPVRDVRFVCRQCPAAGYGMLIFIVRSFVFSFAVCFFSGYSQCQRDSNGISMYSWSESYPLPMLRSTDARSSGPTGCSSELSVTRTSIRLHRFSCSLGEICHQYFCHMYFQQCQRQGCHGCLNQLRSQHSSLSIARHRPLCEV